MNVENKTIIKASESSNDEPYTVSMSLQIVTEADLEAGECDAAHEEVFTDEPHDLDELKRLIRDKGLDQLQTPQTLQYMILQNTMPPEDDDFFTSGDRKEFTVTVARGDGQPLDADDILILTELVKGKPAVSADKVSDNCPEPS